MYEVAKGKIKRFEGVGAIVVILSLLLFRFLYLLTGSHKLAGMISPVNQSVWEQVKLVTVPYLLYGLIEFFLLRVRDFRQFIVAKAAGAWSIVLFTIVFFYTYSGVIGKSVLLVDIFCTILCAILAFVVSYRMMNRSGFVEKHWLWTAGTVLLLVALEIVFTYMPPHIPLFQDPITGNYGIPW